MPSAKHKATSTGFVLRGLGGLGMRPEKAAEDPGWAEAGKQCLEVGLVPPANLTGVCWKNELVRKPGLLPALVGSPGCPRGALGWRRASWVAMPEHGVSEPLAPLINLRCPQGGGEAGWGN